MESDRRHGLEEGQVTAESDSPSSTAVVSKNKKRRRRGPGDTKTLRQRWNDRQQRDIQQIGRPAAWGELLEMGYAFRGYIKELPRPPRRR